MAPPQDGDGVLLDGRERYFASGSNHAGEIRACALSGINVGIAALHLNEEGERELSAWVAAGARAFLDSTAFGEVAQTPTGLVVRKEIPLVTWSRILRLYARLAAVGRGRIHCVAPDQVGNQDVTLQRLALWKPELLHLRAAGARLIVPIQKGPRSMESFWWAVQEVLGFSDFTCGIPSKKAATTPRELRAFLEGLPPLHPPDLHLLGMGPDSPRYPEALALIQDVCPLAAVWCDSVRIKALVGRGSVRKDGTRATPRSLTAARDRVLARGMSQHNVVAVKAAALSDVFRQEQQLHLARAKRAGWRGDVA